MHVLKLIIDMFIYTLLFARIYSLDRASSSGSLFKNERGSNVKAEARAAMCSEKPRKPLFRERTEVKQMSRERQRQENMRFQRAGESNSHSS